MYLLQNLFNYDSCLLYLGVNRVNPDSIDLHELLMMYRRQKCENDKDKVYGVLGICNFPPGGGFQVEYASSVEVVYEKAARYIIGTLGRFVAICSTEKYLCNCNASKHALDGMQSWVILPPPPIFCTMTCDARL